MFPYPILLLFPCSQERGESCLQLPSIPWELFVWQGLRGAVSPFSCWYSQSWSSDRLGNGHLAMGHLVNPAQPRSGQEQSSQLLESEMGSPKPVPFC